MSKNSVGGVDRTEQIDKISLQNAVETPFWMVIWATEPQRKIAVEMSYDDLKIICDLIDKARERSSFLTKRKSMYQKRVVRLEKQETDARNVVLDEPDREDVKEDLNNVVKQLDRYNALIELIEEIEQFN